MSLRLTFHIKMESDYHVSAGHGLGTEIDSALLRDADGVPVLRGTTLTGLLRDGLWRLLQQAPMARWQMCHASGRSEDEVKQRYCGQYSDLEAVSDLCPVCRLFGSPRTMKRWRIGSARPEGFQELASAVYKPMEISGQRVMRVRVNPRTRRAKPRQLFSQEQGGQLTFVFTVTFPTADEAALDEAALMVTAARFVRQLGRSRRRGQGECLFSLVEVEGADLGTDPQTALLQRFEDRWLTGGPEALAEPAGDALEFTPDEAPSDASVRLWVLARADEPLLIAQRAMAGNQFQSQPFIPGKTLRGALATRAANRFDLEDMETYDAFIALFLRGGARFTALYPLHKGPIGHFPAAPAPRDGFRCKVYEDHPIQWGTHREEQIKDCAAEACDQPVKGIRGGFIALQELKPGRFSPTMRSEMHVQIDPETGRATKGQLFEYAALEAGQYFAGELVCEDGAAWETLQALANLAEEAPTSLRLGKGRHRGYGKLTLWLKALDSEPHPWVQKPLAERVKEGATEVTLTLLTDAVVVDPWGRHVTGFQDEWLTEALGVTVTLMADRAFAARQTIDGFNSQLRLPAWRDVALSAGSTVQLKLAAPLTAEQLERLEEIEARGIGLRREEGYGQAVFNHPIYEDCAGLSDTMVLMPDDMALATPTQEQTVTGFRKKWEDTLEGQSWSACQSAPFEALARWLDAHRHSDIDWLLREMDKLGQPDRPLIERIGGPDEYGARDKDSRLTDNGMKLIKRLLTELNTEHDATRQPLGIRMVADRLADAAGGKEEGR